MLPDLRLQNFAPPEDQNTCFANSVLQLLRRVSIIKEAIVTLNENERENEIALLLKQIFLCEGSKRIISTSDFRKKVGSQFSTGAQQDCKEFLDTLLTLLPSDFSSPFKFKIKSSYDFIDNDSGACSYCLTREDPVISSDNITLHITFPNSENLTLQSLIDQHFDSEQNKKKM